MKMTLYGGPLDGLAVDVPDDLSWGDVLHMDVEMAKVIPAAESTQPTDTTSTMPTAWEAEYRAAPNEHGKLEIAYVETHHRKTA